MTRTPVKPVSTTPPPGPSAAMVMLTRIATPMWLAILATVQIVGGAKTLPVWTLNACTWLNEKLSGFAGWPEWLQWLQRFLNHIQVSTSLLLRVMLGIELAGLCVTLLLGRWARLAAVVVLSCICFVTVAEISAWGLGLEALPAVIVFIVSALLLAGIGLREEPGRPPRPAWPALMSTCAGLVAALTIAVLIRFDETLPARTDGSDEATVARGPATDPQAGKIAGERIRDMAPGSLSGVEFLDAPTWVNQDLASTKAAAYLPDDVMEKLKHGTHIIMFFNPNAAKCHEFMDDLMSGVAHSSIVAVRVPGSPRTPPAEDLGLGPIACDDCEMVALPYGPMWFVNVPSIVKVVDGKAACYAEGLDELEIQGCLMENVTSTRQ